MDVNFKLFDAVQIAQANNTPDSRWIKVQLAKLLLRVIDPLTGLPSEVIVEGDANKPEEKENCIYNCWTPLETAYFERNNQYHILQGNVVKFGASIEIPKSVNALTDEEIDEVLNKKFMALKNLLPTLTSDIPVQRLLQRAIEIDKPTSTINAIKARLAELQAD